jgi:ribosomal protein S18 acetylase RimI-like enzyme
MDSCYHWQQKWVLSGHRRHRAAQLCAQLFGGAMSEFRIRTYEPDDREAIRSIVFETGFMGESIEWLWRDRGSFADLITKYYTDREPESIIVAERAGAVVGYLTGCVDSSSSHGSAAREWSRIILRGGLFRPGAASFLWRSIFDVLLDRGAPEEVLRDTRWPAHLHIDLLPEGRGMGIGRRLMNQWFERLVNLGSSGVHLGTFAENHNALGFFEACGFSRHGTPIRAPGFRTRKGERMHVQWMVRSL